MFNLIKWWNKGGGKVIGYDDDYGDRMDSVSNGKLFALVATCLIGAIVLIAIILVVKGVLK